MAKVAIIGAGSFGTAFAIHSINCGHDTTIIARDECLVNSLKNERINHKYLPHIQLPEQLKIMPIRSIIFDHYSLIILSIPGANVLDVASQLAGKIPNKTPILILSKSIDFKTLSPISVCLESILQNNNIAVLSGPTFAAEVAESLPTACLIASKDILLSQKLSYLFTTFSYCCIPSNDPIGLQLAGAMKNVIAIASGIIQGAYTSNNAQATIITKGFKEMIELGLALGGKMETFTGLAGIGDLFLTASSKKSRNFTLGQELSQGRGLQEIMALHGTLCEGILSAKALAQLVDKLNLNLSLCRDVDDLLSSRTTLEEAIQSLLRNNTNV